MSPSPKHFCEAHQIRRSVLVMAAPVMVLELMLRQAAAAIDKAGGYRACAYSPRAQPSLVGSTCTVGEPAPPATPPTPRVPAQDGAGKQCPLLAAAHGPHLPQSTPWVR